MTFQDRVRIGLLVAACLAGLVVLAGLRNVYPDAKDPAASDVIRIAAANLFFRNSDPLAGEVLARLDADLLVLRERTRHNLNVEPLIERGWIVELDEPAPGEKAYGAMVLRRPSVRATASTVQLPLVRRCDIPLTTVLTFVGERRLCVLGVHVPDRHACGESHEVTFDWLTDRIDDGRLSGDLGECGAGDPVVLAGDFNALAWSREMIRLRDKGLADSYGVWQLWPAGTWAPGSWFPAVARIDYILVPPGARTVGAWIVKLPGSDHRAVVADLRFE